MKSSPALQPPALRRSLPRTPRHRIGRKPFFLLLASLLLLASCSAEKSAQSQKGTSGRKTAVAVTTALCRTQDVPLTIEATGRVEASATVGIRSRINGTLDTVHFREGQAVRQGDLLFSIDRRPYEAQVKLKEAALAKDRAELANAEKELQRYLPAAANGYVSQAQADQAQTKVESLKATVQEDLAALDNARLDLQYCSLTAPFAGLAGEIQADAGNLIKANADTPLVTINRIAPISIAFDIPGEDLARVRDSRQKQQSVVQATLPGRKDKPEGSLSFVDNSIDPATGTILVKADFANTTGELWPGQLIPVSLQLGTRQAAPVVPSQAIQVGQDSSYVYVVRPDATVEYRQVTIGAKIGRDMLVETGLTAGERVVTDGHLQLSDGASIEDRSSKPAGETGKKQQRGGK